MIGIIKEEIRCLIGAERGFFQTSLILQLYIYIYIIVIMIIIKIIIIII